MYAAQQDRHIQVFWEEAKELLDDLEKALLELEAKPSDKEAIGRVFRDLHTIKGSSAMFGLTNIVSVTHEAEALYDRIRSGSLAVTKEIVDISLTVHDHLRALVVALRKGRPADEARTNEVIGLLKACSPEPGGTVPPTLSPPGSAPQPKPAGPITVAGVTAQYRIRFRPPLDIFMRGIEPMDIVRDIRALGDAEVNFIDDAITGLLDLNPEECHAAWDILLKTGAGLDAIKDVFMFVEEDSEISIEQVGGPLPNEPMAPDESESGKLVAAPSAERASKADESIVSTIKVAAEKLDTLVNLVGEMVAVQAGFRQSTMEWEDLALLSDDTEEVSIKAGRIVDLIKISRKLERLVAQLSDNTMSMRMLPIGLTFSKFRRLVRDLSRDLGKSVELNTEGGDTELDKSVIEHIDEPLVHLIRNAVDHGIESPDEREAAGKPRQGLIELSAEHEGAFVIVRIRDDGHGIDADAVREKAEMMGMIDRGAQISDKEIFNFIFEPGFSTAAEVTSVSGRGVGMDAVKRSVGALRGSIEMKSTKGKGTEIILKMPLSMAIIECLWVKVGTVDFMLPLTDVLECIEYMGGLGEGHSNALAKVRGEAVPFVSIRRLFGMGEDAPAIQQIVVTGGQAGKVGFLVDRVVGGHQTVIKSLGGVYRDIKFISGATILGSGAVALILDTNQIYQQALREDASRGTADLGEQVNNKLSGQLKSDKQKSDKQG